MSELWTIQRTPYRRCTWAVRILSCPYTTCVTKVFLINMLRRRADLALQTPQWLNWIIWVYEDAPSCVLSLRIAPSECVISSLIWRQWKWIGTDNGKSPTIVDMCGRTLIVNIVCVRARYIPQRIFAAGLQFPNHIDSRCRTPWAGDQSAGRPLPWQEGIDTE